MKKIAMKLVACLLFAALIPTGQASFPVALSEGADISDPSAFWIDGEAGEDGSAFVFDDADVPEIVEQDDLPALEEDLQLPVENMEILPIDMPSDAAESTEEPSQAQTVPSANEGEPVSSSGEITLGVGETYDLASVLITEEAGQITWSTGDSAIADVTQAGAVTAIAPGDTVVTAAAEDGTTCEYIVHVKKAPDIVAFNFEEMLLGKGEQTDALRVVVGSVEGEYAGGYTLASDDAKIVKVYEDGTLKGVKVGKTKVKVTTYNNKEATCIVEVKKAPGSVSISSDKSKLGVGESGQIAFELPAGTAGGVTFASSKPGIVEVDAVSGVMKALKTGKATVSATTFNGKTASIAVRVLNAPQSLSFEADDIRVGIGMELSFIASLDSGSAGEISYTLSNKKRASYENGCLTGLKKGKTVLTAKTYNGLEAQCTVNVVAAPKAVTLPFNELSIGLGQKYTLEPDVGSSAATFTYTSSKKSVVAVSDSGILKGKKKGKAVVTVTTYNGKSIQLTVKVVKAAGSVSVSPKKAELGIDEKLQLTCAFPTGTSASVTYASNKPGIAVVDPQSGEVTGVAPGKATITATTHNGHTAKAKITVLQKPDEFRLVDDSLVLAVGQSFQPEVEMTAGTRTPLYWTSDDPNVASVSDDGEVLAVGAGETTIRVATNVPELTDSLTVTVWPAPQSLALEAEEMIMDIDTSYALSPIITDGSMTQFTYTSSDESIAVISEEGIISAIAVGETTITVTTHNDLQAQMHLIVEDPWFPESIELIDPPEYINVGQSIQLQWSVVPESALAELVWESSNDTVATVDADGLLTGLQFGYVTITATSQRNPEIVLSFSVFVQSDELTLQIPARTTSVDGIAANLEKIYAIRASAYLQIDQLKKAGTITASDASKRKQIVKNAFEDYAFPWMTLKKQKYWKKKNSEGGRKDFKTDRVYYGVPYTSGSGRNREYNKTKLLKENRYYDSGKGYYILNQKNLRKSSYCGNDCSCFVDAAIWGTNSSHSDDRTKDIAKSSAYKTISSYNDLRTGDLICKSEHHVVMFLYYTNADRTQMMIIENGGIEKGTNTVHCMIMKTKWYTNRGYKVRRLKSLG